MQTGWIDYAQQDFTDTGDRYDLIFDAVGKSSRSKSAKALTAGGSYLSVMKGGASASQRRDDLVFLKELIEAGELVSVIDRTYPLEQTAQAHEYVDSGAKKGHVVITVTQ